jgi:hypothetical protein
MRAKASLEYLRIAAAIADCITISTNELDARYSSYVIRCRGPGSIFAALKVGIPEIVRPEGDKSRQGPISEIELYKFLSRSGYVAYRFRHRIRGTKDMWSKGVHLWRHRRWLDPRVPEELSLIRLKLAQFKARISGSYIIQQSQLLSFLAFVASEDTDGIEETSSDQMSGNDDFKNPPGNYSSKAHHFSLVPAGHSQQMWCEEFEAVPHSAFTTIRRFVPSHSSFM